MRIPFALKLGYTAWLVAWMTFYGKLFETSHFLWLCHIGNVIIAAALWSQNRLLFSWQAVSLLVPDLVFVFDVVGRLVFGLHPIGGTEYMFDPAIPLAKRALSLFHFGMPVLIVWGLWRFGYDRRAVYLQVLTCWIVFPLSYIFGDVADNVNWVRGPFGREQHAIAPLPFLSVAMVVYPLVVYVPSHFLICLLVPRRTAFNGPPSPPPSGNTPAMPP